MAVAADVVGLSLAAAEAAGLVARSSAERARAAWTWRLTSAFSSSSGL
ncbi:hypothetical protein ACMATS_37670 [Streptoverticillium reticulum]